MTNSSNGVPGKSDVIVASMHKEHLRSMFYLFAGKPDSRIKVFDGELHLTPLDIVELNDCVTRKLDTHNTNASISTVRVGYFGSEISEFGTWAEFQSHHWQEPERVEEIVVKWDFLVNMVGYATPQRHTLLFRVSSEMKPGKFLQLLSSGNSDDFDSEEMFSSPAFCRVDFINGQISKELVNVVGDWHKGRRVPDLARLPFPWIRDHKYAIARILDHWLVLSWVLLLASVAAFLVDRHYPGGAGLPSHVAAIGLFLAVYSLTPVRQFAQFSAGKVFDALRDMGTSRVIFEFTSGDKKKMAELQTQARKQRNRFLLNAGWNVTLNILASLVYACLFSRSG